VQIVEVPLAIVHGAWGARTAEACRLRRTRLARLASHGQPSVYDDALAERRTAVDRSIAEAGSGERAGALVCCSSRLAGL